MVANGDKTAKMIQQTTRATESQKVIRTRKIEKKTLQEIINEREEGRVKEVKLINWYSLGNEREAYTFWLPGS